jgi:glycosyltransferase involved in cell wall biosynthesis
MRIGIAIRESSASKGGSHTLERSLLDSLHYLQGSHELTLIDVSGGAQKSYSGFQCIDLQRQFPSDQNVSNARRIARWTRDSLLPAKTGAGITRLVKGLQNRGMVAGGTNPANFPLSSLDGAVQRYQLDVVWFVGLHFQPVSVPFFFTVYDLEHRLSPWFPEVSTGQWPWEQREAFYATVLPRASRVITGTEVGKQQIMRFYGVSERNIRVVPFPVPSSSGVPTPAEADGVRTTYDLPETFFLYPAQFWAHKNHINLLRALHWAKANAGAEIHLVFVGADKGNEPYVRKTTESLGLGGQVKFLGFIPERDLIALYKLAFGLVYVSYFGPDNLPPLEAMNFGCPVIAADHDGAREQLQQAAVFVDPSDPVDIGKAILRLSTQPGLRQSLVDSGFQLIKSKSVEGYMESVQKLLGDFEKIRVNWP